MQLTLRTVLSRRPSKARTAPGNAQRLGESKVFLDPAVGEQFQTEGFILFAMPSLNVPAPRVRVTSLSFPSLRKVGDLYSRFDPPSGRRCDDCWFFMAHQTSMVLQNQCKLYVKTRWRARPFLTFAGSIAIVPSAEAERQHRQR